MDFFIANQAKLLHHRKRHHIDSVPACINMISGECKYGIENCWFNHGDSVNTYKNEIIEKLNAIAERIFQMMDKCIQQIMKMKETNNLK